MKYAAIDVGSNAVRLLIADVIEVDNSFTFKKNTFLRVPVRLGEDSFIHNKISINKADDLVKAMTAFRNLMDIYEVTHYMACATSAMRDATNGQDVIKRIREEANINLEIIEGKTEANIIARNIERYIENGDSYLYIDVGGGSTEISIFSEGTLVNSHSFNIGTIRLLDNKVPNETWDYLKTWVKENTKGLKGLLAVGTGGNINRIHKIAKLKTNTALTYNDFRDIYDKLNSHTLQERIKILGLKEDRADVIVPASEIYLTVMRLAGIKQIYVPKVGMVDGIIQLLIEKDYPKADSIKEIFED